MVVDVGLATKEMALHASVSLVLFSLKNDFQFLLRSFDTGGPHK